MPQGKDYIAEIKNALSSHKDMSYAFVFGSVTKQLLPESDIDILVGADLDSLGSNDYLYQSIKSSTLFYTTV